MRRRRREGVSRRTYAGRLCLFSPRRRRLGREQERGGRVIRVGRAGVHLEDQSSVAKKCGHMAGKVLVAVSEHVDRLVAARLQFDIMGVETVLVARTDAVAATLIQTNIDARDHRFILGATTAKIPSLAAVLSDAMAAGKSGRELEAVEAAWTASAQLKTFGECVKDAILASTHIDNEQQQRKLQEWSDATTGHSKCLSHEQARDVAASLGVTPVLWDWDLPRTREGFYWFEGSVAAAVVRRRAFAPHADVLWMETSSPDIGECAAFAEGVRPETTMLAYNLSSPPALPPAPLPRLRRRRAGRRGRTPPSPSTRLARSSVRHGQRAEDLECE